MPMPGYSPSPVTTLPGSRYKLPIRHLNPMCVKKRLRGAQSAGFGGLSIAGCCCAIILYLAAGVTGMRSNQ